MLHNQPSQIAAVQILRNYLKHRENAVDIHENRHSRTEHLSKRSTKMFTKCDGVRNSAVNKRRKRNLRRRKSDREIRDSTIGMPVVKE